MLSVDDFRGFFREIHGYEPFPWQERLLRQVVASGVWPEALDLPTGAGKTAAIDIAVFHLALEADRSSERRAPVRIAFVVDRRLVVDDAFGRAQALAGVLAQPGGPVTGAVADRLRVLSGGGEPLVARRLRGGIPRENDWARTPSQPTILCSTVDQIGSRLLFRGYGVSDSMKPVHAGLIGADCLILLDEAHLAQPFRQTLGWVRRYRGRDWRESANASPWGFALLTATLGERATGAFTLGDDDRAHPVLKRRLQASKPARLVGPPAAGAGEPAANEDAESADADLARRAHALAHHVQAALAHFRGGADGTAAPAIGVVVNRVARARAVHSRLQEIYLEDATVLLLIGPARPVDRDHLAAQLAPVRTGAERALTKPFIVVATQCLEVGVDIDLDALVTELAPLDALRQRFGRLNRDGRSIVPYAAIVAAKRDLSASGKDDPVYGNAIRPSWDALLSAATAVGRERAVDFGIDACRLEIDPDALTPRVDASVLLPAHLDLLSQTAPIPAADPEVALFLHGPGRQPDSITVVWRSDLESGGERSPATDLRRLLTLVPPRSGEAIELPLWAVRRWLLEHEDAQDDLADAATVAPDETGRGKGRRAFRWKGNTERSEWVSAAEMKPGDAVVVPARYGGIDAYGWTGWAGKPQEPAEDVGRRAALLFASRTFAVRVGPGLIADELVEALADAPAQAASSSWRDLRAALLALPLPEDMRADLALLDTARAPRGRRPVVVAYTDLYGFDSEGRPKGIVFVAPFGIDGDLGQGPRLRGRAEDTALAATEDDASGSLAGVAVSLEQHSRNVEARAEAFASAAGLSRDRVADLKLAGYLHDAGKADRRFQAWLHYGDPFASDPETPDSILAKSDRPLPASVRSRAGLPLRWRHEALSVRLAPCVASFAGAKDPDLVLWLLGSHHGHGRPLFPHADPEDAMPRQLPAVLDLPRELPAGAGPQSLAFDWHGLDWPTLFGRLKARYGVWELARMEAILRLADHRASEGELNSWSASAS